MTDTTDCVAPEIVPLPTSCHCGGNSAYVLRQGGRETMLGCTCHTTLDSVVGLVNALLAEAIPLHAYVPDPSSFRPCVCGLPRSAHNDGEDRG